MGVRCGRGLPYPIGNRLSVVYEEEEVNGSP